MCEGVWEGVVGWLIISGERGGLGIYFFLGKGLVHAIKKRLGGYFAAIGVDERGMGEIYSRVSI